MARKLTDEDILRISRARVIESSNATFTEIEIDTQLSVERGIVWLVDFVEFTFETTQTLLEVGANSTENIALQLTKTTQASIINANDPDLIQNACIEVSRATAIGTDAGPLWYVINPIVRYNYNTPFPIASQSLYLSILGTDAGTANSASIRIGYVIREVSDKFFFRVAQALVG